MPLTIGQIHARYAAAVRWGNADAAAEAKAELVVLGIETAIRKRLTDQPPLSAERAKHLHAVIEQFCSTNDALTA
jgi:hypothetical protein